MKRIICLVLCLVMLSTLFISCKKEEESVETQSVSTNTDGERLKPNIPDDADLEGKNIVIYNQPWNGYAPLNITDLAPEEASDAITEAAFNRRYNTEEKLNCTIEEFVGANSYSKGLSDLQAVLNSGDDTYTVLMIRAKQYSGLIGSGYLVNVTDIPHIDIEKPWWDEVSLEALSISNNSYAICGDITVNDDINTFNIYFNKKMVEDYKIEESYQKSIYQMVKDGEWTIDIMYAMAKIVVSHPAADGVPGNTDEDVYGFGYVQDASVAFLNSFGVYIASVNKEGIPEFSMDGEANISKMQKLLKVFQDTNTSINFHTPRAGDDTNRETQTFLDNRELFSVGGLYYAPELRQSETDFGIIPMPKYDKDQDGYNAPTIGTALTLAAVPYCNADLESTGIFMEYFAYEGYYGLRPALYDRLLDGQIARDVESLEMLDIIFDNLCYDTGLIFNFKGIADEIFKSYNNLEDTIMSSMVANKKKVNLEITSMIMKINNATKDK